MAGSMPVPPLYRDAAAVRTRFAARPRGRPLPRAEPPGLWAARGGHAEPAGLRGRGGGDQSPCLGGGRRGTRWRGVDQSSRGHGGLRRPGRGRAGPGRAPAVRVPGRPGRAGPPPRRRAGRRAGRRGPARAVGRDGRPQGRRAAPARAGHGRRQRGGGPHRRGARDARGPRPPAGVRRRRAGGDPRGRPPGAGATRRPAADAAGRSHRRGGRRRRRDRLHRTGRLPGGPHPRRRHAWSSRRRSGRPAAPRSCGTPPTRSSCSRRPSTSARSATGTATSTRSATPRSRRSWPGSAPGGRRRRRSDRPSLERRTARPSTSGSSPATWSCPGTCARPPRAVAWSCSSTAVAAAPAAPGTATWRWRWAAPGSARCCSTCSPPRRSATVATCSTSRCSHSGCGWRPTGCAARRRASTGPLPSATSARAPARPRR